MSEESFFWQNIPNGWKLVKGSEVFEVNPSYDIEGEVTYIGMDNLHTELPYPSIEGIRDSDDYSGQLFKKDDVIFPRITPSTENGKRAIIKNIGSEYGIGSTEFIVLSPDQDEIAPWYLFYLVNSHVVRDYAISRMRGSTGRQRVPYSVFRNELDIALPPKTEQRRIVSVLYNVDQAIQKTEEIIEQTQRVKKGLMQDLFTKGYYSHEEFEEYLEGKLPASWNRSRFGDLLESTRNGIYKSEEHHGSGTPILKMGDMFDDLEFDGMPEERLKLTKDEAEKYRIEQGDLLFARRSLNVEGAGKCTLIGDLLEPMVFESSMIRVRLKGEANPDYLAQYFNSPIGERNISRIVMTLAASGIRGSDLKNLKVPMPGPKEQEKIAEVLFDYDKKIQGFRKEKEQLRRIKKGLMQDLLTGKVRTNNKDIEVLDEVLEAEKS